MLNRTLTKELEKRWNSGKAIVILGPRQVGKTTLLKAMCEKDGKYLSFNADDNDVRLMFEDATEAKMRQIIGDNKTIFIDEAQRIKNIGLVLKLIHDQIPNVRLLVSGSSSLDIANSINEPLTGRKWEYNLWPISFAELTENLGAFEAKKQLESRLILGMYPEVINNPVDAIEIIKQLTGSYLYKDLLSYQGIRKPELLDKLLKALALQLGNEVSYAELSRLLNVDRATIEQYIGLLEKAFVVFRLNPLSRNLRTELNTNRKVYFYDNGVRNALINDFKPVEFRTDIGALWENFLISERIKHNAYRQWYGRNYFWRTYQQQEIDYIEETNSEFYAYEFKWNKKLRGLISKSFKEAYKPKEAQIIHKENFESFVGAQ